MNRRGITAVLLLGLCQLLPATASAAHDGT
jgi:hypothetical protein